jgi:hypothetical protein
MAIFESLGGAAIIGGGMSLLGGILGNQARRDEAQSAQGFSAEQYAHRYQTQVKDLQAAGLSPMLAYSQGPGASPTGVAAQVDNVGSAAAAGAQAAMSTHMTQAQIDNIKADTELKNAQAEAAATGSRTAVWNAMSSQALQEMQSKDITAKLEAGGYVASAQESVARSNLLDNQATEIGTRLEHDGPKAAADLLRQQFKESLARTGNLRAATAELRAKIEKIDAETTGQVFDNAKKEAFADFYQTEIGKNSPMAEFFLSAGKDVSDMILGWRKAGNANRIHRSTTITTPGSRTTISGLD